MATDPSQLMSMLAQNSGLAGQYFLGGQDLAAKQQANDQALAMNAAKLSDMQRQTASDANFQTDWANYLRNPTTDALAQIAVKYPSHTDSVKQFWSIKDPDVRQSHLNAHAPVVSALQNGKTDLAITSLQSLRDATAKAGQPTDDLDQEITALQSGDKDAISAVKGTVMMHLAAIDNDGKFAESLARTQKAMAGPDPYTLNGDEVRYDGNNNVVARGPGKTEKMDVFDGAGHKIGERLVAVGAGQGPSTAAAPGAVGASGKFDPHAFFKSFTLPHEGGYAAHDANGAPVNMGVNQSANPGVDVKNLTQDQAADIFVNKYAKGSENMSPALGGVYADTAYINPKRAQQFLQASGGDPAKFLAMRKSWMANLVAQDPVKYGPYQKAWANRNRDLGAYIAQQAGGGGAGAPQDGSAGAQVLADTSTGNRGAAGVDDSVVGSAYLATLPAGRKAIVQSILDGKMAAPKPGSRFGEALAEDVARVQPGFDPSIQPSRMKARSDFTGQGKGAVVAASGNRLAYHLNDLYSASKALVGPDLGWNPLSSAAAAAGQSFQGPALARYKTILPFISGELQKLTKNGTATEGETKIIMQNLAPSQASATRLAAIQEVAKLAQGQFHPFRDQWQAAFPGQAPPVDFTRTTQRIFDHVSNDNGPLPVDHNGNEIPRKVSSIQQAKALEPGTPFIDPHGKLRYR